MTFKSKIPKNHFNFRRKNLVKINLISRILTSSSLVRKIQFISEEFVKIKMSRLKEISQLNLISWKHMSCHLHEAAAALRSLMASSSWISIILSIYHASYWLCDVFIKKFLTAFHFPQSLKHTWGKIYMMWMSRIKIMKNSPCTWRHYEIPHNKQAALVLISNDDVYELFSRKREKVWHGARNDIMPPKLLYYIFSSLSENGGDKIISPK